MQRFALGKCKSKKNAYGEIFIHVSKSVHMRQFVYVSKFAYTQNKYLREQIGPCVQGYNVFTALASFTGRRANHCTTAVFQCYFSV